jgi:hypothetical protein
MEQQCREKASPLSPWERVGVRAYHLVFLALAALA